jgi:hypothetical protein
MVAIPMLRRNVELEISAPAICAALARQLHIPNNFTFVQPNKAIGLESHIGSWLARCLEPTLLLAKLHEPTASNHHRKHETDEI